MYALFPTCQLFPFQVIIDHQFYLPGSQGQSQLAVGAKSNIRLEIWSTFCCSMSDNTSDDNTTNSNVSDDSNSSDNNNNLSTDTTKGLHAPVDFGTPGDPPASDGGHGTSNIKEVIKIFETAGIPCCMVGISALRYFGAAGKGFSDI